MRGELVSIGVDRMQNRVCITRPNMPEARQNLYLMLMKKNKRNARLQQLNLTNDRIDTLELTLERAKRQKQNQLIAIRKDESVMGRHLQAAIKQACFQDNSIVQVVLAVHPLSKEPAIGRLTMSFLSSIEIKSLRSTCRAMTCFVHVECEETAIARKVYIGRDSSGWKNWGIRYVLEFKTK